MVGLVDACIFPSGREEQNTWRQSLLLNGMSAITNETIAGTILRKKLTESTPSLFPRLSRHLPPHSDVSCDIGTVKVTSGTLPVNEANLLRFAKKKKKN